MAASAAAARKQVEASRTAGEDAGVAAAAAESRDTEPSFSAAPGSFAWSRGPYWFSASSHGTDGDVGLPATAEEMAALARFMAGFPY